MSSTLPQTLPTYKMNRKIREGWRVKAIYLKTTDYDYEDNGNLLIKE